MKNTIKDGWDGNDKLPNGDGKVLDEGWELVLPKGDGKLPKGDMKIEGWDGKI